MKNLRSRRWGPFPDTGLNASFLETLYRGFRETSKWPTFPVRDSWILPARRPLLTSGTEGVRSSATESRRDKEDLNG
jgi:hypothetical protein